MNRNSPIPSKDPNMIRILRGLTKVAEREKKKRRGAIEINIPERVEIGDQFETEYGIAEISGIISEDRFIVKFFGDYSFPADKEYFFRNVVTKIIRKNMS